MSNINTNNLGDVGEDFADSREATMNDMSLMLDKTPALAEAPPQESTNTGIDGTSGTSDTSSDAAPLLDKPEPKGDPISTEPVAQPEQQPSVEDPEVESIQHSVGMSPTNKKNWMALKGVALTRLKKIQELEGALQTKAYEIDQARQTAAQTPQIPDEIVNRVIKAEEDAERYRLAYEYAKNPTMLPQIAQLDQKRGKLQREIFDIMKRNQAQEDELKAAFGSKRLEDDWKERPNFWEEEIFTKISHVDRKLIENRLAQLAELGFEQQDMIDAAVGSIDEFKKHQEEEVKKHHTVANQTISKEVAQIRSMHPELQRKTVPPNATPDQAKEIQTHNAWIAQQEQTAQSILDKLYEDDHQAKMQATYGIMRLFEQEKQMEALQQKFSTTEAENKRLQSELSKIKNSGKVIQATSSAAPIDTNKPKSALDYITMDSADAFDAQMAEIGGKRR